MSAHFHAWFSAAFFATRPLSNIHALPSIVTPVTAFSSPVERKYSLRPMLEPPPFPTDARAWRGVCKSVCGDTAADAALVAARGGVLAGEKTPGVPADRIEAICAGDAVLAEGVA